MLAIAEAPAWGSLTDEEAARIAWEFFEREQETIARLLMKKVKQYGGGLHEMLGELAFRLPGLVKTYRLGRGTTLRTHVYSGVNWWLYKLYANSSAGQWGIPHSGQARARKRRHEALYDDSATLDADASMETSDEVQCLLSSVDPYDRSLLNMRFACEMSYESIGDVLGVTRSIARDHVLRALARLRRAMPTDCGASDEVLELMADLRRMFHSTNRS